MLIVQQVREWIIGYWQLYSDSLCAQSVGGRLWIDLTSLYDNVWCHVTCLWQQVAYYSCANNPHHNPVMCGTVNFSSDFILKRLGTLVLNLICFPACLNVYNIIIVVSLVVNLLNSKIALRPTLAGLAVCSMLLIVCEVFLWCLIRQTVGVLGGWRLDAARQDASDGDLVSLTYRQTSCWQLVHCIYSTTSLQYIATRAHVYMLWRLQCAITPASLCTARRTRTLLNC